MMNKKGEILLRHIVIILILFAGIMLLASLLVNDLADAYDNPQMTNEFNELAAGKVGSQLIYKNLTPVIGNMSEYTSSDEGVISSFISETGIIKGAGQILLLVLTAPSMIGETISSLLISVGVNLALAGIIHTIINFMVYTVIIFVLISALLRGSKM